MYVTKEVALFQALIIGFVGASFVNGAAISDFSQDVLEVLRELVLHEGRVMTFDIITKPLSWNEAAVYCKERHGDLATIRSPEDNDLINLMIKSSGVPSTSRIYTGGTSTGSDRGFFWISDGVSISYKNWKDGKPTGAATNPAEKYPCLIYLYNSTTDCWQWDNYDCGSARPFACEFLLSNVPK